MGNGQGGPSVLHTITRDARSLSQISHEDEVVIREGYMHKEGHVRKSWKLRLFQLTSSGNLRYYGDEEKPPIDSIPLGGCTISEPKSKRSGHPHAFRLDLDRTSGDKAKYVLSAADLD